MTREVRSFMTGTALALPLVVAWAAPGPAFSAQPPASEPAKAPAAAGKLVFSRDIAPILVANCTGCHNPKDKERRGKLDLSTFEAIMEGTPADKVIVPGEPAESHLVLRIKGEETPKMPQGGNRNLSEAAIAKIEQWVKEGALIDAGRDPKAEIASYAASAEDIRKAELARLPAADRDRRTEEAGRERFKKGNPRAEPEVTTTDHFLLLGVLPKERAAATLKALEGQYSFVRSLVGPGPLDWGEKASVYVFNETANYVEFVRAVESREVDPAEGGSARFGVPQPYVVVLDPLGGRPEPPAKRSARAKRGASTDADGPPRSLAATASEPFVAALIASAGKPPRWLSMGLGAYAASRVDPRSAYYQAVRGEAYDLWKLGWTSQANDALGSATKASDIRAVGFAAIECLAVRAKQSVVPLTRGMLEGQNKLDDTLRQVLGARREQFLALTGQFVGTNYGRGR